jgi:pyruvate-formate lyase-activating enzyme
MAIGTVPVGLPMSGDQLREHQRLAAQHVTFSVTESCPLRCVHCIVATVPANDRSRTMPMERAESYAAQMGALARRGVRFVSFTGGEPLLARRQLQLLSRAARDAGMESTVVTACHWATSTATAEKVVASLPDIECWQVSTDEFHRDYVSVDHVIRAAKAASKFGRNVMVRLSMSLPESDTIVSIYNELREALPDIRIFAQPIIAMGRGASVPSFSELADVPAWPCVPQGMVVRFDGTVAPCCAGLVDTRDGHPFQYPNADTAGLEGVHQAWCTDPLLQLIRAAGFAALMPWLREIAPEHDVLAETPRHPCEFCTRLWTDPGVGPALRERISRDENRAKVAALAHEVFGETFMLEEDAKLASVARADEPTGVCCP